MEYLQEAFEQLLDGDGLMVMARGLGLQRLIARFLRMYCENTQNLVICLNMASAADQQLMQDALLADGLPPQLLPRLVNNELLGSQREVLYKQVRNIRHE